METTSCCLCNSPKTVPLYLALPDFLHQNKKVSADLVRCDNCGLIYQNPRPDSNEIAAYYPDSYELYEPVMDPKRTPWLLRLAYEYGLNKRSRYITQYKHKGRLLDIGCASGTFLNTMKTKGEWDLYGVEISAFAANIAREQYGLDIFTGTLEKAAYPDQTFDVVTLWDVLEHLHNPVNSLKEINRILKKDGLMVLRIPNGASWDAQWFGRYWAGLEPPRHLYVFTTHTIHQALLLSGFEPIKQNYISGVYPTFLLSLQFWLSQRPGPEGAKKILLKFLHHPIIRLLAAPVFFLIGAVKKGPLLTLVAQKTEEISRDLV